MSEVCTPETRNAMSRELVQLASDIDSRSGYTHWRKKRIAQRLRELAALIEQQWEADYIAEMEYTLEVIGEPISRGRAGAIS